MTRQFVSKLTSSLIALSIGSSSFAQDVKTLPPVTVAASTAVTVINAKLTKAFNADFKDALGPTWYRVNKNYLVSFINDDMHNNVLYRKNGAMIYNVTYGVEKNLPKEVRNIVKSVYYDYGISSIINVKQDDRDVWIVNMQYN